MSAKSVQPAAEENWCGSDYESLVHLVNDNIVDVASGSRLLGVEISDTINWSAQCEKVANKLRSVTNLFTMLREKVSESVLKQVYFAYAQSHIMYTIIIWGHRLM